MATKAEKAKRAEELQDDARVMETDFGRRVARRMIYQSRIFESTVLQAVEVMKVYGLPFEHAICYVAGRQDNGRYWQNEFATANPSGYDRMNTEALERKVREESVAKVKRNQLGEGPDV